MDTIPFTNRQNIVKVCVVGMLGLAVLLGSSTTTLATSKYEVGATYCSCNCGGSAGGGRLMWKKKGACSLANGKNCTIGGRQGTLDSCDACKATSETICDFTALSHKPGGGVIKPPAEQGDPVVQPPLPYQKPGTDAGVLRYRGVEDAPATTGPTEKEDKPTAPK